jgi:hypothetical protein
MSTLGLVEAAMLEDDTFEGSWGLASFYPSWFSPYPSREARLDAFALTLTAGSASEGLLDSHKMADQAQFRRDYWAHRAQVFGVALGSKSDYDEDDSSWRTRVEGLGLGNDEKVILEKLQQLGRGGDAERFIWKVNQRCHSRRLFLTRRGYYGIGPEVMEYGDIVAVLFGAKVPYILRKTSGGRYYLLGECYVHGIMDGEVIERWKRGKDKKQVFDIV